MILITESNPASADLITIIQDLFWTFHQIASVFCADSLPAFMITWTLQLPQCFAVSYNPAGWLQDSS